MLFESRPRVGGHAHTIPVAADGRVLVVDVGAQFFAPGPHPTYSKLLEVIGLTKPGDPSRDATIEAELSITAMEEGRELPRFVSPATNRVWPLLVSWNRAALLAFFVFALAARQFTRDGNWLVPLDAWLRTLPVGEEEREKLLLPLVSAMVGCSIDQARGLSARSALVFVGQALPDNPLAPFVYRGSLLGLGGNVQFLAKISETLTTHTGSFVTGVRRLRRGGFAIRNRAGVIERMDVVVFATPPYVTRLLLPRSPPLVKASRVLRRFEYFPTQIAIHRDPVYMPQNPALWSAYNLLVDGG